MIACRSTDRSIDRSTERSSDVSSDPTTERSSDLAINRPNRPIYPHRATERSNTLSHTGRFPLMGWWGIAKRIDYANLIESNEFSNLLAIRHLLNFLKLHQRTCLFHFRRLLKTNPPTCRRVRGVGSFPFLREAAPPISSTLVRFGISRRSITS